MATLKKLVRFSCTITFYYFLLVLLNSCVKREEYKYVITEGQLVGTWSFVKFEYNNVEYLVTDENVCNLIIENLGDVWFINTDFTCEWGNASLSGRLIVRWQFQDNCNPHWHMPTKVNIYEGDIIEIYGQKFKAISYNGSTLVFKIQNSINYQGFPQLPIGGIYTFTRSYQ
jgi:hypothetical protein